MYKIVGIQRKTLYYPYNIAPPIFYDENKGKIFYCNDSGHKVFDDNIDGKLLPDFEGAGDENTLLLEINPFVADRMGCFVPDCFQRVLFGSLMSCGTRGKIERDAKRASISIIKQADLEINYNFGGYEPEVTNYYCDAAKLPYGVAPIEIPASYYAFASSGVFMSDDPDPLNTLFWSYDIFEAGELEENFTINDIRQAAYNKYKDNPLVDNESL